SMKKFSKFGAAHIGWIEAQRLKLLLHFGLLHCRSGPPDKFGCCFLRCLRWCEQSPPAQGRIVPGFCECWNLSQDFGARWSESCERAQLARVHVFAHGREVVEHRRNVSAQECGDYRSAARVRH